MSLIDVEAVPVSSKPPLADDSMRTSTGGKYDFGTPAPSLTRASPMHFPGVERGSAILSKLVKSVGPSSTRPKDISVLQSICRGTLRTLASFHVYFYVCLRGET